MNALSCVSFSTSETSCEALVIVADGLGVSFREVSRYHLDRVDTYKCIGFGSNVTSVLRQQKVRWIMGLVVTVEDVFRDYWH
jgi:hypothetical protein